jgi:hypothetical protein
MYLALFVVSKKSGLAIKQVAVPKKVCKYSRNSFSLEKMFHF